MKNILKKIRKKLVSCKIYIDRAKMYISYINFFMIVFLFVDKLKNYELTNNLISNSTVGIIIILPVFMIGSILLGWIDIKLGVKGEENKQRLLQNPIMKEMYHITQRMDKKIKNIEEKLFRKGV